MNFSEVSTTMKCIISLTIQYMVVYTALGICRSYLDFTKTPYADSQVQKALKSASETMFYAPMVCLMFVGFVGLKVFDDYIFETLAEDTTPPEALYCSFSQ